MESAMDNAGAIRGACDLRHGAAVKYPAPHIEALLGAGCPPPRLSRYFYFEDVEHHDRLFWSIAKAVTGVVMKDRTDKPIYLEELKRRGVFLIDLKDDPNDRRTWSECVDALIHRCRELSPEKIIVLKGNVFDATFTRLRDAGLPVINRRVPFPTGGNELEFASVFAQALKQPPPLPPDLPI